MDLLEVSKRTKEISNRHPWELARFKVVNDLIKHRIKNNEDFNVFDIGCGDIFFVNKLSELYPNCNFYAIDISFTEEILETFTQMVKGKKIFLYKTLDEAAQALGRSCDMVLLLDVVEHIEYDLKFLKELHVKNVVGVNTDIVITVPAYQSLFCSHDHFLGHYRRYTNYTLSKLIADSGYEKKEIGYFFWSLLPPRVLQVLKEKLLKKDISESSTGLVAWNGGKVITALLERVLMVDYHISRLLKRILKINLPGLSNYVICRGRV